MLNHENIIQLKEIVFARGRGVDERGNPGGRHFYMVFEFMNHDLWGLVQNKNLKIALPNIKFYMKHLLTGLRYVHDNKILHRDIKGDNILLDDEGNLKIADFGLARKLPDGPNEPLTCGAVALWYRPPELLLGSCNYGPAVDIWSSGCIFVELLWRKVFLKGDNAADQLNKIYSIFGVATEYNWPGVSELPKYQELMPKTEIKGAFKDTFRNEDPHAVMLLEKMLTLDPSQRISAKDALEHDFFRVEPLPSKLTSLKGESSLQLAVIRRRRKGKPRRAI